MHNLKFVVRWTDAEGKDHRREYDTEKDAKKAKDWLTENGAPSVDIAVKSGNAEYSSQSSDVTSMFPVKEQPTQQNFF